MAFRRRDLDLLLESTTRERNSSSVATDRRASLLRWATLLLPRHPRRAADHWCPDQCCILRRCSGRDVEEGTGAAASAGEGGEGAAGEVEVDGTAARGCRRKRARSQMEKGWEGTSSNWILQNLSLQRRVELIRVLLGTTRRVPLLLLLVELRL